MPDDDKELFVSELYGILRVTFPKSAVRVVSEDEIALSREDGADYLIRVYDPED